MSQSSTVPILPATQGEYDPLRQAAYDKASAMSRQRAERAEAEHTFYEMLPGTAEGEFSLRSPNLDRDCRYPFYAVNILLGTCDCPDSQTHVARMNDELEMVGLPPSVTCAHIGIVLEKLAAGWQPEPQAQPVAQQPRRIDRAMMEADFA